MFILAPNNIFKHLFYLLVFNYICCISITSDMEKVVNQGQIDKQYREMFGIKQEGLAMEL